MDDQQEIAYCESNGHVIEIEDGDLVDVCTLWVFFSSYQVFCYATVMQSSE